MTVHKQQIGLLKSTVKPSTWDTSKEFVKCCVDICLMGFYTILAEGPGFAQGKTTKKYLKKKVEKSF